MGKNLATRDERAGTAARAPQAPLSVFPSGTPPTRIFCDDFETGDTSGWPPATQGVVRVVTRYVWRSGVLAAAQDSSGFARHFGPDHLGTVRAVTNDLGEIVAQHTYFPFGREATASNQDAEAMRSTGQERDLHDSWSATADDLDYLHARYRGVVFGRFLSIDPLTDTPVASATPQLWNRYSYSAGNPLKLTFSPTLVQQEP